MPLARSNTIAFTGNLVACAEPDPEAVGDCVRLSDVGRPEHVDRARR